MDKFKDICTCLLINFLKIIMIVIVVGSIGITITFYKVFNLAVGIQIIFYVGSIYIFYRLLKNININRNTIFMFIMGVAFIARLLWLLNANTVPVVSDFRTMYTAAEDLLMGDVSAFQGAGYIARFPHLTVMVLYMAMVIKMFSQPIMVMKIVNLIASLATVAIMYKLCKEIFGNKNYGLIGSFFTAIFPPMITYVGVFATENIAIPFYLMSIYLFIRFINGKNKIGILVLASVLLLIGNLFRMVAVVTIIALIIYIIVYYNAGIKEKVGAISAIIAPFLIMLCVVNFIIKSTDITEFNLWKGSEPAITNILKGTNIKSGGSWSEEDAAIPKLCNYNYEKMENMSKEIIKERLENTSVGELAVFYIWKIGSQWSVGDLAGVYWSELSLNGNTMIVEFNDSNKSIMQLFYGAIMLLSYVGLFNKRRYSDKNPIINLFYIIFCGYGLLYLITENQSRYAYIVCWLFIIFSISGIERIVKWKSLSSLD